MGFLQDLKNLLWVKKAVGKSAAEKASEEFGDFADESLDALKDFGEKTTRKTGDAVSGAKDFVSDAMDEAWEKRDQAAEKLKSTGEKVKSAAAESFGKAKTAGAGAMDQAVKASDKVWEKAEEAGGQVREKAGEVLDKAKEMARRAGERIDQKLDDMFEKAQELDRQIEAEKDAIDKNRDGFADTPLNEKLRQQRSLMDDKDDFWAKAERFAEGDYGSGKPEVIGKDDTPDSKLELRSLKGFEDRDGDGDPLIDDAQIVKRDDKDKSDEDRADDDDLTGKEDSKGDA